MKILKTFIPIVLCLFLASPASAFWGLADTGTQVGGLTPDTIVAGDDGKYLVVDWAGNKIDYGTPPGGGDMTEAVYASGADGFIDADAGGTDIDSSGSTGVPSISAGTWSVLNEATFKSTYNMQAGTDYQTYSSVLDTYAVMFSVLRLRLR